jgi:hypothetical protein
MDFRCEVEEKLTINRFSSMHDSPLFSPVLNVSEVDREDNGNMDGQ